MSAQHRKQVRVLSEAAALRKALCVAKRRKPGPMPSSERKAFARIVSETELNPWQLVDELLGALLDEYPFVSVTEAGRWLVAPTPEGAHYDPVASQPAADDRSFANTSANLEVLRFDSDPLAIIGGEHESPGATPIARGLAEGGSST